ncbi:dCTP deaminase [Hymenobacter sp. NST-14]|uniref:dCTP deaminase n=1 Tax=Hymenobacter piscis TaxID=2839984 RepID=UPI001C038A3C|nr:dCTP deaminase [Hymenobacter piscis]MBT9392963.1 dCTP deaminase [Hymenobacter piscis]
MLLQKSKILKLVEDGELIIRPLLENEQINETAIDFRLGYDFLVSVQSREPFINASLNNFKHKPLTSFFQETRRKIGDTFMLYPNQTVLATSLEFIKLPNNVLAELNMRSSYARLGITISTILQPGYCGCISLELTNTNINPINLTVGARLFQARLTLLDEPSNYFENPRKYICQVRPEASAANFDSDLHKLNKIWLENNV